MTTTPPRIDPRLGAAALRAPAASMVDSRPQAILKLRPRNSFDYRVRYEPQPSTLTYKLNAILNYHFISAQLIFNAHANFRLGLFTSHEQESFNTYSY